MEKISETIISRFIYNSEEEREQHVESMESQGYKCTGEVRKTFDSSLSENAIYHWYSELIKNN